MSDPQGKAPTDPASGSKSSNAPDAAAGEGKRSGRASFDERGNSVWEWQLETGVYSRDVSTQKLKKLELDELSIADTAINQLPPGLGGSGKKSAAGGGFNPYDNSPRGGINPYDKARTLSNQVSSKLGGPSQSKPAAAQPQRTPADARKLNEWMKLKKRVEDAKDDED